MKTLDFLNILAFVTVFAGVITIVNYLLKKLTRVATDTSTNLILDYSRSLFPVLLVVLIIRTFVFQPYRVPTGSLEPTVMPGDMIFATQYNYGLKLPFWDSTILKTGQPKRGDIVLFHWPVNPTQLTLVKRVIGLPGDHVSYINKVLYINGEEAKQHDKGSFQEDLGNNQTQVVERYQENLDGIKHDILRNADKPGINFRDLVVPQGMYFVMGDNRDNSDDSRSWGFVPSQDIFGKARFVFFNMRLSPLQIKWDRIGDTFSSH